MRGTIGSVSFNCTKIDTRTQEACADIVNLRQELAAATEAKNLETRATSLREQIAKLRERGGSIAADPIGNRIGTYTSTRTGTAKFGITIGVTGGRRRSHSSRALLSSNTRTTL
jgi:hypothetical protein